MIINPEGRAAVHNRCGLQYVFLSIGNSKTNYLYCLYKRCNRPEIGVNAVFNIFDFVGQEFDNNPHQKNI